MSITTFLVLVWLAGALPGLAVGLLWATRPGGSEDTRPARECALKGRPAAARSAYPAHGCAPETKGIRP